MSGRPRVKDPAGRYACRTCYDDATAREDASDETHDGQAIDLICGHCRAPIDTLNEPCPYCGQSQAAAPSAPQATHVPIPTAVPEPSTFALEPLAVEPARPAIAAGIPAAGVAGMATQVQPVEPGRETHWPLIMGVVTIIVCIVAILFHVMNVLALAVSPGQFGLGGGLVWGVMGLGISSWGVVAAVGLVRRRPEAMSSLRAWAITKIVIALVCNGGSALALGVVASAGSGASIPNTGGVPIAVMVVLVILIGVAATIWPIVLLITFARRSVRDEVATWRRPMPSPGQPLFTNR